MEYMAHYTAMATSPFPDERARAAWYSLDSTCEPPQAKVFLLDQASERVAAGCLGWWQQGMVAARDRGTAVVWGNPLWVVGDGDSRNGGRCFGGAWTGCARSIAAPQRPSMSRLRPLCLHTRAGCVQVVLTMTRPSPGEILALPLGASPVAFYNYACHGLCCAA
jgi:hypothetical protein